MKKILLPLLLAAAFSGHSQKISNKLTFQKGQKLEFTTNMNITSESMLGESTGNTITIDEYTVNNASASESTLLKSAKKMKLSFSVMGKDYNIDSDNKEDMEGQFGEPIKKIMQGNYEFTVDAFGKITGVKADAKQKKEDEGGSMMSMMMPGMNAMTNVPKAGAPSIFKILPDGREVAKGDSWTDSVNVDGNRSISMYIVKDITAADVLLDYTSEGTTKATQSAMGMTVDVTGSSKMTGTITLDKATGILKQRTATVTTEANMNMGGQAMTTSTKMTMVTNVKAIDVKAI